MKKLAVIIGLIMLSLIHEEVIGLVVLTVISAAGLIAILNAAEKQKGARR